MRDEVPGRGTELGDELDGGRAVDEVLGPAQQGRDERRVGGRSAPIGPEPGRAVDHGDPRGACRVQEAGRVRHQSDLWCRRGELGKARRSPTTPRWISMVSTAARPSPTRSAEVTGMLRTVKVRRSERRRSTYR